MANSQLVPWLIAIALNTILAIIAFLVPKKLLTPAGILHGWFLGVLVWGSLGWQGYTVVLVYFLLGSAVTRLGMADKESAGIAEARSGARGPENVWGSALVAALCAVLILCLTQGRAIGIPDTLSVGGVDRSNLIALLALGYVASFATKLSDTCASEVGKAYGQRTFLITTLKPVPRGTEGAISLEGTVSGILASVIMATVGWAIGMISPLAIPVCVGAAFIATTLESLIGATLQTQLTWLTNELVNVINTTLGALIAIGLGLWLR